jgi:hypothetical protein
MTPSSTVFTPKTNHTCHQKPNSSRATVPLHKQTNLVCDLRGGPAPVQCPTAVPLLLIPSSSSEVVDKKVHRHPTHLTLQHRGKKFNLRVATPRTVQYLLMRLNPGRTGKFSKKFTLTYNLTQKT